jgi:hypothetical protein
VAQRHLNYYATDAELEAARDRCVPPGAEDDPAPAAYWACCSGSGQAVSAAAECAVAAVPLPNRDSERAEQARLLRDIFGNPFRATQAGGGSVGHVAKAVEIARVIYEGNLFEPDQFEDLAEALEREGWDVGMAAHCRNEREHVPGCWVVDLILGKA